MNSSLLGTLFGVSLALFAIAVFHTALHFILLRYAETHIRAIGLLRDRFVPITDIPRNSYKELRAEVCDKGWFWLHPMFIMTLREN